MKIYENLNKINFLKPSFLKKLGFIYVLGFLVQTLILICCFLFVSDSFPNTINFLVYLILSILTIISTFYCIKKLINPIIFASIEMNNFVLKKDTIQLPINYDDEVGLLLKNINYTIKNNNKVIEEKVNLITLLTHDLKQHAGNPISLCQLLLQDKSLSKRSIEIVDFILASSTKQVDFIDNFIELLKMENNISEAKKSVITLNINELKLSLLKDFNLKLSAKNIKLVFNATVEELVVEFENIFFYQILSNLIDNSIKFSSDGSTIIVDIKIVDSKYSIAVIDNGIGFDPLISSELFNKFTIYGRLGTHNEKSNGIGLYLCRTIAEKFNAKIVGISKGDHQGAKFILVIDMHK